MRASSCRLPSTLNRIEERRDPLGEHSVKYHARGIHYKRLTRLMRQLMVRIIVFMMIPLGIAQYAVAEQHSFDPMSLWQKSKSEAAAMAQSRHGGKVLKVTEKNFNGKRQYQVKLLLDSGKVKIVTLSGK